MPTRVVLIRHGETDWNAQGRIQGHLPVALNTKGQAQADAVGRRLAQTDFTAIYSSDLKRARQTAEVISDACGQGIRTDIRLREWNLGVLAGLTVALAEHKQPRALHIHRERIVDEPIPDGESIRERYERVTQAVQDIADRHDGHTVVVVSHGGPLGDCYRRTIGIDVTARIRVDLCNAALNHILIDGNRWMLEHWGDIDHLKTIGSLANWEGRHPNTEH